MRSSYDDMVSYKTWYHEQSSPQCWRAGLKGPDSYEYTPSILESNSTYKTKTSPLFSFSPQGKKWTTVWNKLIY